MISVTPQQRLLLEHYQQIDPDLRVLGAHRGRPVIWTHTNRMRYRTTKTKRHVVVLGKGGEPFDLPKEWEEHFVFGGSFPKARVRRIIDDWMSWSIRA